MSFQDIKERVSAGVALLNEKAPDWRSKINVDELDMVERNECILGQVFGHYNKGLYALGLSDSPAPLRKDRAGAPYGFWVSFVDSWEEERDEYAALKSEWLTRIAEPAP